MNIILVVVDTFRRDAISPYDQSRDTPNFDRIAERSVVFDDVSAASCWTMPSHASMLTGLYPSHHRAMEPLVHLPADIPLISEHLQSAGYETHAINIPHPLSGDAGFNRGWDEFQNTYSEPKYKQALRLLRAWIEIGLRNEPLEAIKPKYFERLRWNYRTRYAVDDVVERINRDGDRFVFTNLFAPHADYKPLPRYAPEVSNAAWKLSEITRSNKGHYYRHRYTYGSLSEDLPDTVVDESRDLYQGEIRWVDQNLGRMWDRLDRNGRLDDTAIIITGDHGELFGESEEVPITHRNSLHPMLLDVPFLFYHPDITPRRDTRLASHVDIAPTILDIADLSSDWEIDGYSLLTDEHHDVVFAEHGPQEFSEPDLESHWEIDPAPYAVERKVARTAEATVRFRSDGKNKRHDRIGSDTPVSDVEVDRLRKLVDSKLTWMNSEGSKNDAVSDSVRDRLRDVGYLG